MQVTRLVGGGPREIQSGESICAWGSCWNSQCGASTRRCASFRWWPRARPSSQRVRVLLRRQEEQREEEEETSCSALASRSAP